jgi:Kef-type K+ transport system membrane component KefB
VLFVGVATPIATLPMLAAIVGERGLARTTAGVIATAATGLVDALAWPALIGTVRESYSR